MKKRHEGTEARRHEGKRQPREWRGMTLVEILAVVVILGLIAGTLLVGFSGSFGKAKHELAKSGIGIVASQLEKYRLEHGAWPSRAASRSINRSACRA